MMRHLGASILFLFSSPILYGQSSNGAIEDATTIAHITVPSPSVASLYKFSDVPVNLSNGSINISIPIYTIQAGSVKWPITLNYSATGIRVNEHASNVGLGWNLDAEGAIIQNVLGWKDNGTDYMSLNGTSWDNAAIVPSTPANYSLLNTLTNSSDGAPDLYVYNLHNQSGKFMITDVVKLMPKKDIAITSYNNANGDKSWKVVDESGVTYYFEDIEVNQNRSYGTATSSSKNWLLSKVIDPAKGDSLIFEYESMFMTYSTGTNFEVDCWSNTTNVGWEWTMSPGDPAIPGLMTAGVQNTDGKQLKKIRFPEGSIEYDISWNTRQDWPTDPTVAHVPQVKNIYVKNLSGEILKTIHFDQSYFSTGAGTAYKRMRLDSVSIADNLSNATVNPVEKYKLKYSTINLPAKNSYAVDHWGYYNGKNTNQTLIPSFTASGFNYIGADRNTSPFFFSAGMLEQLTYPTGGYSEFTWEPHVYHTLEPAPPIDSTLIVQIIGSGPDWIDHTSEPEIVTLPYDDLYDNINATLSVSGGYPSGANSQSINHAAHTVTLYEVSGATSIMVRNLGLSFSPDNNYNKSVSVSLQKGKTYKIVVRSQGGSGYSVVGKLNFDWPVEGTTSITNYVGGCRIAKIRTHDINTPNDLVKKYSYSDAQVYSMPVYGYLQYKYYTDATMWANWGGAQGGVPECAEVELPGWHLTSNSISSTGSGNHVGYSSVKEIYGENGEGGSKTFYYTNFNGDRIGEVDASWRHGLPTKEDVFDASNNLISRVEYHNKRITSEHYAGHTAVSAGMHPCSNGFDLENILQYPAHWTQKVYDYPIDWMYTDTVESTDFMTGIHQLSVTNFDNVNHMQPTRKTSFTSDNRKVTTFIQYPTDFDITNAQTSELDGIKLLQDNHMHNIHIETYINEWLPGSSSALTLSATQYEYTRAKDALGQLTNIPLLKTLRSIDIPGQGINDFYPMDVSSNVMFRDAKYAIKSLAAKYDSKYNLEKLQDQGSESSGYLWGYDGRYTIATVQNLDTSKKMAFTSFEDDAHGNWGFNAPAIVTSDFFTGSRCINMSANHGIYLLPTSNALTAGPASVTLSGSYIVSYWHKNGAILVNGSSADVTGIAANGWTYCEHHLTGTITSINFSGSGLMDELRLYPAESLMKSFTYKPLVGVTSSNDESNTVNFYEYDGLGRLMTQKDVYGNVLKSYTYQTQGPQ